MAGTPLIYIVIILLLQIYNLFLNQKNNNNVIQLLFVQNQTQATAVIVCGIMILLDKINTSG